MVTMAKAAKKAAAAVLSAKPFFGDAKEFVLVPVQSVKPKSTATNVSPDRQAVTVLFDSMQVSTPATAKSKDLGTVKSAAYRIPFNLPDKTTLLGVKVDIRGNVGKTAGGRALLIADVAGQTASTEFEFGDEANEDYVLSYIAELERVSLDQVASRPPLPEIRVAFTLITQCLDAKDQVRLTVDSIDLSLVGPNVKAPA